MVTENAITLYGGEWWGYQYSAVETPEPSTLVLIGIGAVLAVVAYRREPRRQF